MTTVSRFMFLCCVMVLTSHVFSQTGTPAPTVPSLIGLSVPKAAAELNRVGLRLGEVGLVELAPGIEALPNTVESQTVEAGAEVKAGQTVNLRSWRTEKAILIYDDNDITLRNPTSKTFALRRVWFRSVDGSKMTLFDATQWGNRLRGGECVQLWSVERVEGKPVEGCPGSTPWQSRTVDTMHFWTGANGTTRFEIIQDGVLRGRCAINTSPCEFYLAASETRGGIAPDVSEYVFLRYTPQWLQLMNRTEDHWMPTGALRLGGIRVGDAAQYTPVMPFVSLQLLAPGQCLTWTLDTSVTLEGCDEVARATVTEAFWAAPFAVQSQINGAARQCPAATQDAPTGCLVPRLESPE